MFHRFSVGFSNKRPSSHWGMPWPWKATIELTGWTSQPWGRSLLEGKGVEIFRKNMCTHTQHTTHRQKYAHIYTSINYIHTHMIVHIVMLMLNMQYLIFCHYVYIYIYTPIYIHVVTHNIPSLWSYQICTCECWMWRKGQAPAPGFSDIQGPGHGF